MKHQMRAGLYLLATGFLLTLAASKSVQRVEASAGVSTSAPSVPIKGRYNGKLVFASDRHNSALSIWTMKPDGGSPTRLNGWQVT